jgi:hypothetical protein
MLVAMGSTSSPASDAAEERQRNGHRIVYRCVHDDGLTLTDTPCDGDRIDIDLNRNLTAARPAAPARETTRKATRKTSVDTTTKPLKDREARCQRLRAQLHTLQSKLRSGYTAAAGIRLEERKRQLREQAKSEMCP